MAKPTDTELELRQYDAISAERTGDGRAGGDGYGQRKLVGIEIGMASRGPN